MIYQLDGGALDITPTATQPITVTPAITDADGLTTVVFPLPITVGYSALTGRTDIAGAESG